LKGQSMKKVEETYKTFKGMDVLSMMDLNPLSSTQNSLFLTLIIKTLKE